MVKKHSHRKIDARRSGLLAIGEGSNIEAQHTAAAGSRIEPEDREDASTQRRQGSVSWPSDIGALTRRDVLMLNAAILGAIAAGGVGHAQPPELPVKDGLQGWVSTSQGSFLFGDGTTTPGHGKAVHEARNVENQLALFSQATAGLRPTWDANTFAVPLVRSDGTTQYMTRATALALPKLVVVGGVINAGVTGFHAFTGARSTVTPGGDAADESWMINRSSLNTMRVLLSTDVGQAFADVGELLGERVLIMLEISGTTLQVWQNGTIGETTISGTQIAADGEQALLAKYYNDDIIAIMDGGIAEFLQYSALPSRGQRRDLVEYVQGLLWPEVSPPLAAKPPPIQIEQGQSALVDVVTPSSGSNLVLASIDQQPSVGSFSISGNNVQISVPAGAPLDTYSGWYCLRSDVEDKRLVDFEEIAFEVIPGQQITLSPQNANWTGGDDWTWIHPSGTRVKIMGSS